MVPIIDIEEENETDGVIEPVLALIVMLDCDKGSEEEVTTVPEVANEEGDEIVELGNIEDTVFDGKNVDDGVMKSVLLELGVPLDSGKGLEEEVTIVSEVLNTLDTSETEFAELDDTVDTVFDVKFGVGVEGVTDVKKNTEEEEDVWNVDEVLLVERLVSVLGDDTAVEDGAAVEGDSVVVDSTVVEGDTVVEDGAVFEDVTEVENNVVVEDVIEVEDGIRVEDAVVVKGGTKVEDDFVVEDGTKVEDTVGTVFEMEDSVVLVDCKDVVKISVEDADSVVLNLVVVLVISDKVDESLVVAGEVVLD